MSNLTPVAVVTLLLLAGCQPVSLSDAQVKTVTERCKELGMATHLFNSVLVSRADCVPITVQHD